MWNDSALTMISSSTPVVRVIISIDSSGGFVWCLLKASEDGDVNGALCVVNAPWFSHVSSPSLSLIGRIHRVSSLSRTSILMSSCRSAAAGRKASHWLSVLRQRTSTQHKLSRP